MPLDPDLFRQAMRSWSTGVAIVTSIHENIWHGMTVSSFTSLSLTPPQVLIALAQQARTRPLIAASGIFGVSILASDQSEISDRFAGRVPDNRDRFQGLETFSLETGAPFLRGGLACFDCRVVNTLNSGEHTIFIGEVLAAETFGEHQPLIYFDRQYRQLQK
ncbi:MAG: flavin reductase family protein [Anaerolineales bacterium]|jgi:flavin reductase (DIM6/NTAB) family NADH-FMN oxidoreductase RutF|nr:flavin reductase family protein [Anaerolineales bacterium]